jgi:hypothetical protein
MVGGMSTDNPYAGTDNESQWQAGYDSGIASPSGVPNTPLVLDPDQGTIWSEGALAGFTDGQQQGFQTPLNPTSGEEPESIFKAVVHGTEITYEVYEIVKVLGAKPIAVTALPVAVFLILLSLESDPPPTLDDQVGNALLAKCREIGQSEVFTALCRRSDHSGTGDWFLDHGFWHGALSFEYTAAFQQAEAHLSEHTDAIGDVGVAHFMTSAPRDYEFLIIQ